MQLTGTERRHSCSSIHSLWILLCITVILLAASPTHAQGLPGVERGLLSAPAFLTVDEAFSFYTSLPDHAVIGVHWQIVDGHYLYKDKFSFSLRVGETEHSLTTTMPEGSAHEDEFFGAVEVYFSDMNVLVSVPEALNSGPVTLIIEFQGCAEAGLCYTPQRREIDIEL